MQIVATIETSYETILGVCIILKYPEDSVNWKYFIVAYIALFEID